MTLESPVAILSSGPSVACRCFAWTFAGTRDPVVVALVVVEGSDSSVGTRQKRVRCA